MKFDLSKEEKYKVYQRTKKSFEMDLIQRLCAVGIDPDTFNPDEFIPEDDKMSHYYINDLITKIKKVEEKILQFKNNY